MSVTKAIMDINQAFLQRKEFYKGISVKAAFVKEEGVWKSLIVAVTPSFNVASDKKKLDYGDFVILKTYIQLDSFQGLVSNLEKNHTITISDFTFKIENDITVLPLFSYPWGQNFVSSLGSGDIERLGIRWPSKAFILGSLQNKSLPEFSINKWVQKGLPIYSDIPNAIENELEIKGFGSALYWLGKAVFVIPDYRARFTKITIRRNSIVVHIEVSPEFKENLIIKYMIESPLGEEHPRGEIPIYGDSVSIDLRNPPSLFYCFLITEKLEVIDIVRYDESYGYFSRDWIEYDEAKDEVEYLASLGEGQFLEYKKEIGNKKEFLESVVAFANSDGGTIVLGVDDNGNIIGCGNTSKEQVEQMVNDSVIPFVPVESTLVKYGNKPLLLVRVNTGNEKPYYLKFGSKMVSYVRRNGSDLMMRYDELEEMYRKKYGRESGPFG